MDEWSLSRSVLRALGQCAAALWFAAIAFLLFATLHGQVARSAELPHDLGSGTLWFAHDAGFDPAAPLATDVRISIAGIVARISVAQRFKNTGAEWVEAVYAFPLPDDAAVDRLTMRIGDRLVEGEIQKREAAERIYREARDSGRRASLVEQQTPNLFTAAVANIGPQESIEVSIEYLQTARYDAGELSLRFPMTLTERYGAGATPASTTAGPAVPAALDDAPNQATLRVVLAAGLPLDALDSPTHTVEIVSDGDRHVITSARVAMNRDFAIAWRPRVGGTPELTALTETRDGTTYALAMILPPLDASAAIALTREVIYVIDTSGSMGGASIEQAKAALADGLARLDGADRFNVFRFDSTTASLYRTPVAFTSQSYADALRYVESLRADGGTEMEPAIRTALEQPATPGYLRQAIFLTDGGVADETGLFRAIRESLGDARLFTIGIGAAPNSHFMRKAAQFGRGTYTHIGDTADVAAAMQALNAKLARVALANVLIDWPNAIEVYPARVPDLYAGEPIVIAASFPAAAGASTPLRVAAYGRAGTQPWAQSVTSGGESLPGIAALWARRKIEALIDSRVEGADKALIAKLVTEVALEHGLVSPYTSLVAVDRTPARSAAAAAQRQTIRNLRPAGSLLAGFPQTASAAPLYRWLGALLVVLAGGATAALYLANVCRQRDRRLLGAAAAGRRVDR